MLNAHALYANGSGVKEVLSGVEKLVAPPMQKQLVSAQLGLKILSRTQVRFVCKLCRQLMSKPC